MGYVFFIGSSRPVVRVLVPIGCITKNSTWGHAVFASRSVPRPALAFPSHVPAKSPPRPRRSEPTRRRRRRPHGASHPKTDTNPHFSPEKKRAHHHTPVLLFRTPTSPRCPNVPGEVSQHAHDDVVATARRTPKRTQTLTSPGKETEREWGYPHVVDTPKGDGKDGDTTVRTKRMGPGNTPGPILFEAVMTEPSPAPTVDACEAIPCPHTPYSRSHVWGLFIA